MARTNASDAALLVFWWWITVTATSGTIRRKISAGSANPVIRDSALRWQGWEREEKPVSTIPQVLRISRNMCRQPSPINEARMTKAGELSTRRRKLSAKNLPVKSGEGDASMGPSADDDHS